MYFSFVLPAYKIDFLQKSIDSILSQSYKDFELVIVNDCSPHDIDSLILSYSDSRIRYYKNKENLGGSNLIKQWNYCLEYAEGEYVILASDDDEYDPSFLISMKELINKYPEVDILSCRKKIIDEKGELVDVDGCLGEYMSCYDFCNQLFDCRIYSSISNYIFKKESLLRKGGFVDFPVAWYSDDATVLNLSQEHGIVFSPKMLFSFRFSGINLSTIRNTSLYYKKIDATILFYNWVKTYYNNINGLNVIETLLFKRISTKLNVYLQYKTRLLLDEAGWKLFYYLLKNKSNLSFINNKWILKSLFSLLRSR